ncbi:MAG: spermidine synthase, partial [Longimicrobiales bacterium]
MTPSLSLRTAFFCSGTAGLVYEVLWSRYLGLYVGHSAYAQVLVLTVYLGGMAVGSMAVADVSKRLPNPLRWYVGAELALALFGLAFHTVFVAATNWSYDSVFPAIADASWVGSIRWALAGALILPQAIVLGMTFPLMAAGLVREDPTHPGARVADAYTLN